MKYAADHKPAVTERLKQQAARQLRERGVAGVSVKSVMAAEDMTVGGFYTHFESKEAMLAEAIRTAFRQSGEGFYKLIEKRGDVEWLKTVVDLYLSSYHRDHRDSACPVATLMSDIGLQDVSIRQVFEEEMMALAARYSERLAALNKSQAQDLSLALIALLAGAVQLARAVASEELSASILKNSAEAAWKLLEN